MAENLGHARPMGFVPSEFSKLNAAGVAQEVQCYADLSSDNYSKAAELVRVTGNCLPAVPAWLKARQLQADLNTNDAWRRVRVVEQQPNHRCTQPRRRIGQPFEGGAQGATEYSLLSVIGKDARKSASAAATPVRHGIRPQPRTTQLRMGRTGPLPCTKPKHADCFELLRPRFRPQTTDRRTIGMVRTRRFAPATLGRIGKRDSAYA